MREFAQVVDQISESRDLISQGSLSQLRMALLLLDNAVELLIDRSISTELSYGRHYRKEAERTRKVAEEGLGGGEYLKWLEERAIARSTEKKIKKYFDEKLRFIRSRKDAELGSIDSATCRALSAIHRYRNEAYHSNRVRRETIKPVALLLFEIACDLLENLKIMAYSVGSQDDWSEFEHRYGLRASDGPSDAGRKKIAGILRSGVALPVTELAESLADHLEGRFDEFEELLDHACSFFRAAPSIEEKLSQAKEWIVVASDAYEEGNDQFKNAVTSFSVANLQALRDGARKMHHLCQKVAIFAAYADLEDAFEPMEQCLFDLVFEVDERINAEVHERRLR